MSWITVKIRIVPMKDTNKPASHDEANRFIRQMRDDALYGTYGTLDDEYWQDRMAVKPTDLSQIEFCGEPAQQADGSNEYEFLLRLNSELFPPEMGGTQHLFSILAGDLFRFSLPPITLKNWRVTEINFPEDWENKELEAFRDNGKSNHIDAIRSAFKLSPKIPLLAFSFKPRVGFDLKSLEEIAIKVLLEGFNVVELDTRYLPLNRSVLRQLVEMACRIPDRVKSHVGRLSLNLSMRPDLLSEDIEKLCKDCPHPTIIKLDGGFNGFASIQAVRARQGRGPIITCYPLMQNALTQYIPADQYIRRLAGSGADIIYPGNRPDIGKMVRSLDGGGNDNLVRPVGRYQELMRDRWPMLSIAGGIYPGQLQAFYELLGPDVAWFLGGGVALHKDGPSAGAKLCVAIANDAASKRQKAGKDWAADISENLSSKADKMFEEQSLLDKYQLKYVSPKEVLSKINGLSPYTN